MKNNIFRFATSELSQDALFCWLLNFAHMNHTKEEPELTECAKELLGKIITANDKDLIVTSIEKQYKNIDILVKVNDKYNIIIEDKTFTSQHGDQIDQYRKTLVDEKRENIITVYLKIVEQAFEEKNADVNLKRSDLLEIFSKYVDKTENNIFRDYYLYLLEIEKDVMSYQVRPIEKWSHFGYFGFFTHLAESGIADINKSRYGWNYVANPSGGFRGFWWYFFEGEELIYSGLNQMINSIYLQIEDNIIAVKIIGNEEGNNDIRWKLFELIKSKVPEFKKKSFRPGKYMTIGYIPYNEDNYQFRIKQMENLVSNIISTDLTF